MVGDNNFFSYTALQDSGGILSVCGEFQVLSAVENSQEMANWNSIIGFAQTLNGMSPTLDDEFICVVDICQILCRDAGAQIAEMIDMNNSPDDAVAPVFCGGEDDLATLFRVNGASDMVQLQPLGDTSGNWCHDVSAVKSGGNICKEKIGIVQRIDLLYQILLQELGENSVVGSDKEMIVCLQCQDLSGGADTGVYDNQMHGSAWEVMVAGKQDPCGLSDVLRWDAMTDVNECCCWCK